MKLYTEEQVKRAMLEYTSYSNPTMVKVIDTLKPIELPSDKEIGKQAFQVPYDGTNEFYDKSFIEGAKWMKDKIINQNK